jgi:WW domain-containing oxidoreductase
MGSVVQTVMSAVGPALVLKTIPQGAATQLYVATHDGAASARGLYFFDSNVTPPSRFGEDDALAAAVWKRTEELVATL